MDILDDASRATGLPLLLILVVAVLVAGTSALLLYYCADSRKHAALDRRFEKELASIDSELRELEKPLISLATERDRQEKRERQRMERMRQEPAEDDDGFIADPISEEERLSNALRQRSTAVRRDASAIAGQQRLETTQAQFDSSSYTEAWRAARTSMPQGSGL
jgi:hypothetical protein